MDYLQSLRAAYASGSNRFCVAIHEMQPDDPFSIVLHFDGSLAQPWGRIEVRRNIVGLAAPAAPEARNCTGVSDEGDIIELDDAVDTPLMTKIPGAGVFSEDADGSGAIKGLAYIGERLHAFGTSGQLYRQLDDGQWRKVPIEAVSGDRRVRINAVVQADYGGMLMVGAVEAPFLERPEHLQQERLAAAKAGDLARYQALSRIAEQQATGGGVATGFLAWNSGTGWRPIEANTQAELLDAIWDGTSFWVVGYEGTILKVDAAGGIENRTVSTNRSVNITSVARWRKGIVVGSDFALHEWSASGLQLFKPAPPIAPDEPFRPLKIQSFGDTLLVFDARQGIFRLSNDRWERIEIPTELLARKFRGLRPLSR